MVIAINSKYQSLVRRFIQWDSKYNDLVNYNDANDIEDCRKQANAYDKASRAFDELPKREQANIAKAVCTIGY